MLSNRHIYVIGQEKTPKTQEKNLQTTSMRNSSIKTFLSFKQALHY